jgi:hypothetical protein
MINVDPGAIARVFASSSMVFGFGTLNLKRTPRISMEWRTPGRGRPAPRLPFGHRLAENLELRSRFPSNREIYREIFSFRPRIPDLCPNSAILLLEQGISRKFPVF